MHPIIEKLASKELSFGCEISNEDGFLTIGIDCKAKYIHKGTEYESGLIDYGKGWRSDFEVLGHSVYIGDVLKRLITTSDIPTLASDTLMSLWQPLGFDKSLQRIESESGWEKFYDRSEVVSKGIVHELERLKNPQARALFDFLETVIK